MRHPSAARALTILCGVLYLCVAHAQITATVTELCGTSSMQSTSGSGFAGNPATRITSVVCDANQNGFLVDIFNGVESITCNDLPDQNPQMVTFSVDMTCTGTENGGSGVTGSLKVGFNGTAGSTSSVVTISNGITSKGLLVALNSDSTDISGRTCSLTLRADLYAKNPISGECVACVDSAVITVTDTCGVGSDDDDCGFFNVICYLGQGNAAESAFFWIIIIIITIIAGVFVGLMILNSQRLKNLRLYHRALEASRNGNQKTTHEMELRLLQKRTNLPLDELLGDKGAAMLDTAGSAAANPQAASSSSAIDTVISQLSRGGGARNGRGAGGHHQTAQARSGGTKDRRDSRNFYVSH